MKIRDYIGDAKQLGFVQRCKLSEGKMDGVDAAVIQNGNGLNMMVLPGRGMDIPYVYVDGMGLHFFSGTGITAPAYYDKENVEWLRSFFAGTLTTCGITYAGHPQIDGDEQLGLHGRISNTPAEDVRVFQEFRDGILHLAVEGTLKEVKFFGDYAVLIRRVETDSTRKGFTIIDTIENRGSNPMPLMMLYHINFGYPLLNPDAGVVTNGATPFPGNNNAKLEGELEKWNTFQEAADVYPERLFYHTFRKEDGLVTVELLQDRSKPDTSPRVRMKFDPDVLPNMVQWKSMQKQQYVVGLEPCTVLPTGREKLRNEGKLPMLQPEERREIRIIYDYIKPE
ncbi:MAG: aldose 1-epimerase family protein [Spirochaetia bacterium]|nr:aldose 1-epimerase family protein [Spirochaetia bacterium]